VKNTQSEFQDWGGIEMELYDTEFEQLRLDMLFKQDPVAQSATGEVTLYAEDNEDRIAKTSWRVDKDTSDKLSESGFKILLINLLDDFIIYRARCDTFPRKRGVVQFEKGSVSICWLE
jgi:hypothetical protein